jgi:hypothetical protein
MAIALDWEAEGVGYRPHSDAPWGAWALRVAFAVIACGVLLIGGSANAGGQTQVATISGCYDCLGQFDTPTLVFNNSTGGTLDNAQMVLTGYQADNNGITETVALGNLGAGPSQFNWGSIPGANGGLTPGNLTAGDYDDEFINTNKIINDPTCGGGGCVVGGGPQWYAQVGNFNVVFTATVSGGQYNGDKVYSVFSPTTNATGGFVAWEGLNAAGFSEQPCCDVHSGTVTGDLANIYLGTPPVGGAPEPSTWAMLLLGVGVIGGGLRMSQRKAGMAPTPS